ncbi:SDR family NAD(P)-dependent oxidoreductase [Chelatococcus reniformis]|uniref:Dehydrogenase n=1 Tax=Chelatococcus reniformis TaxID=1494448 RepID=A0A916UAE5_9HYPH|nr:glucose 1-dehydrogenase [Chelatococcus reniformis]GGC65102.1 dehydrogenase [Chelatococcus reniformis]
MELSFSLAGRLALVTGGGQGNGRAIAAGLAAAGARVVVVDVNGETAEAAAAEIVRTGGGAWAAAVDVTDRAACRALADTIGRREGPVSILVNNAGILVRGPVDQADADGAWDRTLRVNVDGTYNMVRAFLPALRETRGAIINLGSIQSFIATPNSAAYTASKGAVLQLTKALAVELARDGIRVNAIAPGFIETPMTEATRARPESMAALLAHTPMRRVGQPAELAGAAVFLASAAASYVTGATLPVDGGYLAQ